MNIDKRKNYYLTIDTETANGLDCPFMYDLGGCIHDKKGNVYETFSFIIYEVYRGMRDIMQTAYYAWKIPNYEEDLKRGKRKIVRIDTARRHISELAKERVNKTEDVVSLGDEIVVKCIGTDKKGRLNFSRKKVFQDDSKDKVKKESKEVKKEKEEAKEEVKEAVQE